MQRDVQDGKWGEVPWVTVASTIGEAGSVDCFTSHQFGLFDFGIENNGLHFFRSKFCWYFWGPKITVGLCADGTDGAMFHGLGDHSERRCT